MWQRWNQGTHIFEKSTDNGVNWSPLGLNASIITEGTLLDARLSGNVALITQANVFQYPQTILATSGRLAISNDNTYWVNIQGISGAGLHLTTNGYWNGGSWSIYNGSYPSWLIRMGPSGDDISFHRAPAGVATFTQLFRIDNGGAIYERGRGFAQGGILGWTPTATTQEGAAIGGTLACYYTVVGTKVLWSIYCVNFNIPVATLSLRFTLPPGYTTPWNPTTEQNAVRIYVPGIGDQAGYVSTDGGYFSIYRLPSVNWPAGVGHFIGQGHYFHT